MNIDTHNTNKQLHMGSKIWEVLQERKLSVQQLADMIRVEQ